MKAEEDRPSAGKTSRRGAAATSHSSFILLPSAFLLLLCSVAAFAAEPFLKPGDVIALVGGEDMVVAGELGYLELLLTRALPEHRLKFRCLAWEGDTVFEQRRDLNFPPLEKQLDEIGATVVICQFGQMESLGGEEKLPEFVAAYEKLIGRMSGGGKRRVVVLEPTSPEIKEGSPPAQKQIRTPEHAASWKNFSLYSKAITNLAKKTGPPLLENIMTIPGEMTRDQIHLSDTGASFLAEDTAARLAAGGDTLALPRPLQVDDEKAFLALIRSKNRLWFDYWRVQNWAFLAGDRTSQPSSRDHRDPKVRWFPAERERFLPLIEAKEKEIWEAAAKLH